MLETVPNNINLWYIIYKSVDYRFAKFPVMDFIAGFLSVVFRKRPR